MRLVAWVRGIGDPTSKNTRFRVSPSEEGVGPRLFLVRHGQTSLNAAGVLRGRLDPELDGTGRIEAMAVADVIGRSGLTVVVASPLLRGGHGHTDCGTSRGRTRDR